MIINAKTRVKFRGVECTRTFDYYATANGCIMCDVTYIPIRRSLRDLRGHETFQLMDLAFAPNVSDAMIFLGLHLDEAPAAVLFAALAVSDLGADDFGECLAEYINTESNGKYLSECLSN